MRPVQRLVECSVQGSVQQSVKQPLQGATRRTRRFKAAIATLVVWFWLGWGLTLGLGACHAQGPIASPLPTPIPLVEKLPTPTLPEWIEQISPTTTATPLTQVRIRFKDAILPLDQLDSEDQRDLLRYFELVPAWPGRFRVLTPRMVGFQADLALPMASRFQVRLKAGLKDLKNHQLSQDVAWSFETPTVELSELPQTDGDETLDLKPVLRVKANTELNLDSLQRHTTLKAGEQSVPLTLALDTSPETLTETLAEGGTESAATQFDPAQQSWWYTITPTQPLAKATGYNLEFSPGITSKFGNLASTRTYKTGLKTYAPLDFEQLDREGGLGEGGNYGRFEEGAAFLRFNNPIDPQSIEANLRLTPASKTDVPVFRVYEGERRITLNPWALDPDTTYEIQIAAGLQDSYGQSLGRSQRLSYKTGDAIADLWAPRGLSIFPSRENIGLNLTAVNLLSDRYQQQFRVLQPTDLVGLDGGYIDDEAVRDRLSGSWETITLKNPQRNQVSEVTLPLQDRLPPSQTGLLAYGLKAKTYSYNDGGKTQQAEPSFYGLVQFTNLGVMAQWFPQVGWVRVHQLQDGQPVANAVVEIYPSVKYPSVKGASPTPCATGKTDTTGLLQLQGEVLKTCYAQGRRDDDYEGAGPKLLAIAKQGEGDGQDWAFALTGSYSGSYGYGIDAQWNSGQIESRGVIFSDRQLYQPGETGWLTGMAYYLRDGQLQADPQATYILQLEDPKGDRREIGEVTTTTLGSFRQKLDLKPDQPLGFYRVIARRKQNANTYPELGGEFRVAEFKPPNFKVALELDKPFAQVGDRLQAKANATYLFGAPLQNASIKYYVSRDRLDDFTPKGWEGFRFGRQWLWPEKPPVVEPEVSQTQAQLNAQGQGQTQIPLDTDLPYPMRYRIDAEVTDVANLSVAARQTLTVLPGPALIGLKHSYVAEAGREFPVEVIVTDPEGKTVSGQRLTLTLEKREFSSLRQVVAGGQSDRTQVKYTPIATTQLTSRDQPQTVQLQAKDAGSYRIRAEFQSLNGKPQAIASASESNLWISGSEPVFWGYREEKKLEIKLDKDRYQIGDTATLAIQSPYDQAELFLAVVRDRPLYQTVISVKGSAPQVQIPITAEMLPNAAVEAVLVRQGTALKDLDLSKLEDLSRIGFAPFSVDTSPRALQLQISPRQAELQPGADQQLDLTLKTATGQPQAGEVTVMVVNEAVLQITGYRPPNLLDTLYAEQPITTRFRDSRQDVVLQASGSPLEKGWGFGGGFSIGSGNTRARQDFRALAHYETVQTNAQGQASVKFKLPDDLTTWRVLAVAIANGPAIDGHSSGPASAPANNKTNRSSFRQRQPLLGQNHEATFITNRPLLANPALPQFVRPGDRLDIGVAVTNRTGPGALQIAASLPPGLQFTQGNQPTTILKTNLGNETKAFRFPVLVNQDGGDPHPRIQFKTQLNGQEDAFELPLPVRSQFVEEAVIETGATQDQASIPLNLDRKLVRGDQASLTLELASTLLPELNAAADTVLKTEPNPWLEDNASRLAIAASLLDLPTGVTAQRKAQLTQVAQAALTQMRSLQQPDGGFAAWPVQAQAEQTDATLSDPFVTPYAAEALSAAQQAGITVSPELLMPLRRYLDGLLRDPGQYDACKASLCKAELRLAALTGLTALGDVRADFVDEINTWQANLSGIAQLQLLRQLSVLSPSNPQWKPVADQRFKALQQTIYETGRGARLNRPRSWAWLDNPAVEQAELLRLALTRKIPVEQRDRLVRSLLDLRPQTNKGHWGSSYTNAKVLRALSQLAKTEPSRDRFRVTAQLANRRLVQATLSPETPQQTRTTALAELPQGKHDLQLSKSGGQSTPGLLHYAVTYQYQPEGTVPGRYQGLRVTRTIRLANTKEAIAEHRLAPARPLTLDAGQVYDIGLELISDHPVNHVLLTDPLPAGFEAVDDSFQTQTAYLKAQSDSWALTARTIHKDRVTAYAEELEAGVYSLHYLVRSVTPGQFIWPGAEAKLQYAPEEFGRSSAALLEVKQQP